MIRFGWISVTVTVLWKGAWNDLQGAETTHHARTRAPERVGQRGSIGGVWSLPSAFANRIGGGVLLSGLDVLSAFLMVVNARQRQVVSFDGDTP
jgi:hypothetical protein